MSKPQTSRPEPHCCLYCGRDTFAKCKICHRCIRTMEPREQRTGQPPDDPGELEDRYDEESGPDDVVVDFTVTTDQLQRNPNWRRGK